MKWNKYNNVMTTGYVMGKPFLKIWRESGLVDRFFFASRRRHTRLQGDWSSDVCSSDLPHLPPGGEPGGARRPRQQLEAAGLGLAHLRRHDRLGRPDGLGLGNGAEDVVAGRDRKSVV